MHKKSKYNYKHDILLAALLLALGIGWVLYYIIGPSEGFMTSDCTDSLRWAQATLESGRLISDSFHYAALLPFGGNLIFLPFIAVFGYSMTAQICGLVTYALLFTAALYYLARRLGYGRAESAGLTSLVLLIMSSSAKLREIMWEHIFYYNLGLLFFCFGFGLALRIIDSGICSEKKASKKDYILVAVLCLFSLLAATDGLQTLICFTLPLAGAVFGERFFDGKEKLNSPRNTRTAVVLLAILAASCIGYFLIIPISHGVTAGYANAYSTYSGMSQWVKNAQSFFINWFTLLGVSVESGETLISLKSIENMIGIVGGLILLTAPIILLCRYSRLENRRVKILLLGHWITTAFLMFAVIFGALGNANWRLTPMLGTSVLLTAVTAYEMLRQKGTVKRIGALLLSVLLAISVIPIKAIALMPADYGRENSWHVAAEELEKRGLTYGYANFWWAEAITMFSDNAVKTANINIDANGPTQNSYQNFNDCFDDKDTDRYFLLLTQQEQSVLENWLTEQAQADKFTEVFQIKSEPYDLRGYEGDTLYVYVLEENLF